MNLCARCGEDFASVAAFDVHPCMLASLDPASTTVLRDWRRTSVVVIGADTVRLCEPECRNEVLLDLGVKGGRGGWVYPSQGNATATIQNTGKTYEVTWKRCRPSALHCDLCAHQWRYRVPAAISAGAVSDERRAALAAQGRAALAALRKDSGREAA